MAENEIVPSLGGGREITMEKQQFQLSIAGLLDALQPDYALGLYDFSRIYREVF